MLRFVLTSLGLGFAGFDPLGVMALVAALALGVRRRGVVFLTLTTFGTIVLLTAGAALGGGPWIRDLGHWLHHVHGHVWASLLVAAGAGCTIWGALRLARPGGARPTGEGKVAPRSTSDLAMVTTGVVVGASCLVDPAWYAVVFVAGLHHSPVHAVVAGLIWPLGSHCAMVPLAAFAIAGQGRRAQQLIEQARRRWSSLLGRAASVGLVLVGMAGIIEGLARWHGHWIGHR